MRTVGIESSPFRFLCIEARRRGVMHRKYHGSATPGRSCAGWPRSCSKPGTRGIPEDWAASMVVITELQLAAGPVVYGYLRMTAASPERRRALTQAMEVYCEQHELLLGGVFTDGASSSVLSPAFAALLDVLRLNGTYGAVAPTAAHLGGRRVGSQRAEWIASTGRRLMLVRGPRSTAAAR
jgi:hypothetical protein